MEIQTQHLLRLRGLLTAAAEVIDQIADDIPPGEDVQVVLAIAADAIATAQPRTRREIRHFAESLQRGDEAWLVARSVPGEHRIEAAYTTKLPASVKRSLGI